MKLQNLMLTVSSLVLSAGAAMADYSLTILHTNDFHARFEPISKYDLLRRLRDALGWKDISIEPYDGFVCDRSMVAARFSETTGWAAPSWERMIAGSAAEWPAYEQWRRYDS